MAAFVSGIIAMLITFPFIGYVALFIITKQTTRNHRHAVNIALNYSSVLFVCSVHFFILEIWRISLLWVILAVVILLSMLVVAVHHKVKEEIVIPNIIKGICRINALVFIMFYIGLIGFGLVMEVYGAFG
ncbi:MAG: DUF3397 domain-containing protein [Bacillus sp. (in: firmicutes)]